MLPSKPTIVLVHGAWHTPPSYATFISALEARGFTVHCPHLPSCSNASPPTATYQDDVLVVRKLLQDLTAQGHRIILLMHSYGGAIGTDALTRDLELLPDNTNSTVDSESRGGVIHLLYLCAYILQPGRTIWSVIEEAQMTHLWPQFVTDFDDGTTFPVDPVLLFLGDVDEAQIEAAKPHLMRSPLAAFHAETVGDAWRRLPVTFVATTKDYSVPRVYQDLMLKRVKGEGVEIRFVDVDTAHSCFISREEEVIAVVEGVVGDERNVSVV
ncbi:alpha/beta-hydrolase [Aspergillus keveii]|uniref:Alpha/beta-hydrolase n=1 Tax=Aspergillus keveii TaxID=714993 RepID=A0ABR4FLB0_9EURO